MTLQKYRLKRKFERTPEPEGKVSASKGKLRFVVQKHDASHLHFDFRLEMEGVLKSWAVPKGPSLNPKDKRLAIQVEDHPLDYRTFEGTIPAGNYGAGTVMVWDEGTYEPVDAAGRAADERQLLAELDAGRLRFVLHGEKLRGQFALVRLKDGKGKNWLLIKHGDEFASNDDVLLEDRSVLTQRNMDEIAGGVSPRKIKRASKAAKSRAKPKPAALASHRIKPMLATPVAAPFDRPGWLFEVKWDGYRAIAEIEDGSVRLYSRNQKSFDQKFAPVAQSLSTLGANAVLDGEIVVLDEEGVSQFQLLQNFQKTGKGTLAYYVFDLLYLNGKDLRDLPLRQRKEKLAALLKGQGQVRLSEHIEQSGIAFFQAAAERGLEGVIAKNADSPYREGVRSEQWLKIKTRKRQEAVIAGFTEPRGSRQKLGALVLGVYQDGDLVYVGHAGGGFDARGLADMHARLEPLVQRACPFKKKPKTNAPAHWVEPKLVCEIAFQDWTDDGTMRQPIFLGLREDKPAASVQRETATPVAQVLGKPRSNAAAAELPAGRFTNLSKVYWPEDGFTKGDLLHYYDAVAPFIVPYLRDRPLALNRHPHGIHGASFFQKDVAGQPPPAGVTTVSLASESAGKEITYIVGRDKATLLYLANLGCIEMNPWHSRLASLDRPDYAMIDLDPEGIAFAHVVEAAQAVRKLLEGAGAECYCKTSGKRGLHIFIPLGARYDYAQAKDFAAIVAGLINVRLPAMTSTLRQPVKRRGKIYLDFLQNRRGQTIVAPYSVRPVVGAAVSTPLRWSEVTKNLDPTRFTIRTLRRRLDKVGDLWNSVLGKGIDLAKCLEQLARQARKNTHHPSQS